MYLILGQHNQGRDIVCGRKGMVANNNFIKVVLEYNLASKLEYPFVAC